MDTYHEIGLDGRRTLVLTDEGVQVSAKLALGPSYEAVVKFEQLDSDITVIRQHHQLFWSSIFGIVFFALVTFTLIESFRFSIADFLPVLFLALTAVSIVVAVVVRKQVEYARFSSKSGVAMLDIAKSGPDREKFDEYVKEIQKRIVARCSTE